MLVEGLSIDDSLHIQDSDEPQKQRPAPWLRLRQQFSKVENVMLTQAPQSPPKPSLPDDSLSQWGQLYMETFLERMAVPVAAAPPPPDVAGPLEAYYSQVEPPAHVLHPDTAPYERRFRQTVIEPLRTKPQRNIQSSLNKYKGLEHSLGNHKMQMLTQEVFSTISETKQKIPPGNQFLLYIKKKPYYIHQGAKTHLRTDTQRDYSLDIIKHKMAKQQEQGMPSTDREVYAQQKTKQLFSFLSHRKREQNNFLFSSSKNKQLSVAVSPVKAACRLESPRLPPGHHRELSRIMETCRKYTADSKSFRQENLRQHRVLCLKQEGRSQEEDSVQKAVKQDHRDARITHHLSYLQDELQMTKIQGIRTRQKNLQQKRTDRQFSLQLSRNIERNKIRD